jgi:hypothetical protein
MAGVAPRSGWRAGWAEWGWSIAVTNGAGDGAIISVGLEAYHSRRRRLLHVGLELVELRGVEVVVAALDGVLHGQVELLARLVDAAEAEVGDREPVVELVIVGRAIELALEVLARRRPGCPLQRRLPWLKK